MSEQTTQSRHIGRKIWYSIAIFLSVFVLLFSALGLVGTWVVEQSLSDAAVSIFGVVYDSAGGLRNVGQTIEQSAGEVRQISSNVSDVSQKISQNVADKGLLATLLPQEQEQKLTDQVKNILDTFTTIRETLAAGIGLYQSIDRLPFVNLPKPDPETITNLQDNISNIQATVQELRQSVQDFRSGAAGQINKVTLAADRVTQGMDQVSNRLATLDTDLANLQAFALRMQEVLPTILLIAALFFTLFFGFVIYTQIEMIRLFVGRWKRLGTANTAVLENQAPALSEETETEQTESKV